LDIEIKKMDTHEGITIKALLDNGATGMFIDKKMVAKHGFKLQKLERLVRVKNICKKAKLQAGIKPTVLCSAIDKENLIEFPLDFAILYIQLLL